jgi:hypothetical protein
LHLRGGTERELVKSLEQFDSGSPLTGRSPATYRGSTTGGRMWDDAARHPPCTQARHGLSIRYNEDLDPNEGPGFGCFVTQAILFAIILLLIPVGLFTFKWPVWVLVSLLVVAMILLFFVSMTSVFLLRVFFADRRRGRGRRTGVAKRETRVISTEETSDD